MKPRRSVHVGLPDDTYQYLKRLAHEQRKPQSYVARELMEARIFQLMDAEETETLKKVSRR